MKKVGVIGLGNMGSGIAKNLIKNGFDTFGHDLIADKNAAFTEMGGHACENAAEVARQTEAVFVVVMTGDQAKSVIFDEDGLLNF